MMEKKNFKIIFICFFLTYISFCKCNKLYNKANFVSKDNKNYPKMDKKKIKDTNQYLYNYLLIELSKNVVDYRDSIFNYESIKYNKNVFINIQRNIDSIYFKFIEEDMKRAGFDSLWTEEEYIDYNFSDYYYYNISSKNKSNKLLTVEKIRVTEGHLGNQTATCQNSDILLTYKNDVYMVKINKIFEHVIKNNIRKYFINYIIDSNDNQCLDNLKFDISIDKFILKNNNIYLIEVLSDRFCLHYEYKLPSDVNIFDFKIISKN